MMLPLQEILNNYNVHPKGVIHVGAHWGEENGDYIKMGIEDIIYIEPCKDAYRCLCTSVMCVHPNADFISKDFFWWHPSEGKLKSVGFFNNACGAKSEDVVMYVSHQNQGQSNSILKPELHLEQHREIIFDDAEVVRVLPLDSIEFDKSKYQMLAMDVQGYEGEVLKGATETLKHIDIIYTEVNRGQTYAGNMEIEEMDELLSDFKRVETYWPSPNWTWGDAVYIRKTLL